MGVFDDKKFEELDWISQATEPIDSHLNEILGLLPEETIIDFNMYKKMVGDSWGLDLNIDRMVSYLIHNHASGKSLSWQEKGIITPLFKIEMSESGIDIDFEKQIITGEIKLVKVQSTLDEKVLEGMLGKDGIDQLNSIYVDDMSAGMRRANEVMEILGGCDNGLRTRSLRRKVHAIRSRLVKLFKANEWKIKDTELANKVGKWIRSYIVDGNLAAWSNFCRLKVMTHKDQPIYSMEEVK